MDFTPRVQWVEVKVFHNVSVLGPGRTEFFEKTLAVVQMSGEES